MRTIRVRKIEKCTKCGTKGGVNKGFYVVTKLCTRFVLRVYVMYIMVRDNRSLILNVREVLGSDFYTLRDLSLIKL